MITIYHNNRCRKSREGLAILEDSGKEFKVINYLDNPPSKDKLEDIIELLGIKPRELVRTNEAIWKEKFKGKVLTDSEIVAAMANYPKLIERPIVINGTKAIIGRPPKNISAII